MNEEKKYNIEYWELNRKDNLTLGEARKKKKEFERKWPHLYKDVKIVEITVTEKYTD